MLGTENEVTQPAVSVVPVSPTMDGASMAQDIFYTRSIRGLILLGLALAALQSNSVAPADERADFFESRIRPLLMPQRGDRSTRWIAAGFKSRMGDWR